MPAEEEFAPASTIHRLDRGGVQFGARVDETAGSPVQELIGSTFVTVAVDEKERCFHEPGL